MSTTDLYVLNGRSTRHVASFRNGWGSAPVAWDHLGAKYVSDAPVYSLSQDYLRKVWDLADDPRLELHERIVLMMTFDRAFVPVAHLADAAEACEKFGRESQSQRENHWAAIGDELRTAAGRRLGRHARGMCLSCTSVSDPWGCPSDDQLRLAWSIFQSAEGASA